MEVDQPAERARFGDHPDINSVALSPDGRWVAAGSRRSSEIKVWDRATGLLVAQLPDITAGTANAFVAFSPDGQGLVTGSQAGYRFWQAGSWRLARTIPRDRLEEVPGLIAFAPDGQSMAITPSPRSVQLIETATGRALANLSAPDPHEIRGLCFSPDGSQLAVVTDDPAVQIWQLWQIRQHLAAMRIDWDTGHPPASPTGKHDVRPRPVQIRVDPGEERESPHCESSPPVNPAARPTCEPLRV
jgi:WD40 repeat protein